MHRYDSDPFGVAEIPQPSTSGYGMDMDMDVPISALTTSESPQKGKQREDSLPSARPRTLGQDRRRENVVPRELAGGGMIVDGLTERGVRIREVLPHPPLMSYIALKVEGLDESLDIHNMSEERTENEIVFMSSGRVQWLDYLPSPVLAATAAPQFCAVALLDCSVNVYSPTGRK